MTDYQPDTPRAALAVGAMALTGLTLAALVVAPMLFDSRNDAPLLLAAAMGRQEAPAVVATADARQDTPARLVAATVAAAMPTYVAIVPARLDVVGTREPIFALDNLRGAAPDDTVVASVFQAPNVAWAMPNGSGPCRPHG